MAEQYWIVKQEPEKYPWSQFVKDGSTAWTGVRNFLARNHLRAMQVGDLVLYYHSVTGKAVMGIARVKRTAYPDPTATEGDWSCVELEPWKPLAASVSLESLKSDPTTQGMSMLRQTRLSVSPVTRAEFQRILEMSASGPGATSAARVVSRRAANKRT